VTLASHAAAGLREGSALRLPAHPAFMTVRRARVGDGDAAGDVQAWFAQVRDDGGPIVLLDAGIDGDAIVGGHDAEWRVTDTAGAVVVTRGELTSAAAAPTQPGLDAVTGPTAALAAAGETALSRAALSAPALWSEAVSRALAILASAGTGEELSDVAWPHFLLPGSAPLGARRLAAAAATLWLWDGPGAWSGEAADRAHHALRRPIGDALVAAVAAAPAP
jgi:hypothetical protein